MRVRVLLVAALCVATPSLAEQAAVNFHLDPMVGTGLDKSRLVTGAALKIDTTLIKALGPVSPQVELFGIGASDNTYLHSGSLFGGGIGLRLRLLNDEKGYFFNPGTTHNGNLWGNLWVDAHATLNSGGYGVGFDVGLGAEFSLVEGLNVGPLAKFMYVGKRADELLPHMLLMFGLSFTIGAPQTTPADVDYDGDGVKGDADKCIDEAEDLDGFEDTDGCPEKDNDKDGIEDDVDQCRDSAEDKDGVADDDGCPEGDADGDGVVDQEDKCPDVKGVKENNGCADSDKDGDTVVDRLDSCVDVKGAVDNKGCPDLDRDGDTVLDRLDGCPDVAGPVDNKGCAYPDSDKDGVVDNFDNCVNEVGTAENQGCPANQKQLVAITAGKIELKDKVYFDTGKATIQARSNALLDQVARVLNAHKEISSLQVEGHTDNTGSADTNRKLSSARAQAVVDYLVKNGVAVDRLKATGFGPDRPTADNKTAQGRDANRRVEFNILSH